jgi:hypothetical protein
MLDNLKKLLQEIKSKETERLCFQKSLQNLKYFNEKFEILFSDWLYEAKKGNRDLVIHVEEILKIEIEQRKKKGEYANPKRNNSLWIITGFRKKLNYLHFEIEKFQNVSSYSECYCFLRQKYNINPEKNQRFKEFGKAFLYHKNDIYIIYECENCSKKWIKADAGGAGITIKYWTQWNPDEYQLIEHFD